MFNKKDYIIEFNKLVSGVNNLSFSLNTEFVETFSDGQVSMPISVTVELALNKNHGMYELDFQLKGNMTVACDNCLEEISVPVDSHSHLIIKISEFENYDDDEIVYLPPQSISFDISQFLYDSLITSMPIRKTCELISIPCKSNFEPEEPETNKEKTDPRWDKLKDILNI